MGTWVDAHAAVGLAHRRLSIIDLSPAASQPMSSVRGRYQVILNGEIYNYKSLQRLLGDTYEFNRNSDTAILGPLFDRSGPDMLDELEGIFALAIWDREKRELFLARDHAGIKPLYYARTPAGLVFASELKALVGLPGVDLSPDPTALADYLTLLWSPGERTPVSGIKKLLPGHWLKATLGKNERQVALRTERWYAPPQASLTKGRHGYDDHLSPADLQDLLDVVVAEQCTSDVPVGAFLSGGVDSSALVASMVQNARCGSGPAPAMTYCIGFQGQGMEAEGFSDDLTHARAVAKQLGVPLTPLVVRSEDVLARLPLLAALLDEPTADPAPLFVQDICARARADGIKVLLSGSGGDDVMTGYRRHLTARLRQRLGPLRRPAALALSASSHVLRGASFRRSSRLAGLLRGGDEEFLLRAFTANSDPEAWRLLKPEWRKELADGWHNGLTQARDECRGQDLVNRLLYMELFGFLPDHNLNYCDKASMANGVEVRVPLIDRRLLSFMARVDPARKLDGLRLKAFFKDAVAGRLPDSVVRRQKTGFGAPIRGWLTSNGPGRKLVEDALFSPEAADWFDLDAVRTLWRRTSAGEVDGAYTVLALAMCGWWRNAFTPLQHGRTGLAA